MTTCPKCGLCNVGAGHVCVSPRPALHPTTRALLAAMREAYRDASLGHHAARARREWVAAGCPDSEEP